MNHQQYFRAPAAPPQQLPEKKAPKKHLFVIVLAIIFAGLLFSTYYFWQKYRVAMKNQNASAQEEVRVITEKIRKFMDLPEDETPNIAKVSNKEKLVGQPFFQKSQNGDMVLIYLKAKRAILYRPSANRVIDMVSLSENQAPAPENPPSQ